jgi:hypothetical protein
MLRGKRRLNHFHRFIEHLDYEVVAQKIPVEGIDFLTKSIEHVRGRDNPDQSYSRTSLVRRTPIGVGRDG